VAEESSLFKLLETPNSFQGENTMSRLLVPALSALLVISMLSISMGQDTPAKGVDSKAEELAIRQLTDNFVKAFNAGKAEDLVGLFDDRAELADDSGTIHTGSTEIKDIFSRFFKRFPGATSTMTSDSIRLVGASLAIEDGQRVVLAQNGQAKAAMRYTLVLLKQKGQWKIVSARESEDESALTPHDRLQPLAWLVGDWVDEGSDAVVSILCRWSDDKNFLLVDFNAKMQGKPGMKSNQRIGWDPLAGKVKSWVFDSDGGYGDGVWTQVENRWVIKSSAVMPDGMTGSATIILEPNGKDGYVMKGFDRIRGDNAEPDFEITIARKPPEPAK
jgi:uncharacterized protein (TIGR02246 family)